MKRVNRYGIAALSILTSIAVSPFARAQTGITAPPPGLPPNITVVDRDTARVQKLAADLSLNQNQSVQILAIMKATHMRERAIRATPTLTPAQKVYRLQIARRQRLIQIASVLTPPQRMRFREIELGA